MVFNFKHFLRRYEQDIIIVSYNAGAYNEDTGQWVPGSETEVAARAAVVPLTDDELTSEGGGRYTSDDRKMYYHGQISQGQEVKVGAKTYLVDRSKDYGEHAGGLMFYMLVRKGGSA